MWGKYNAIADEIHEFSHVLSSLHVSSTSIPSHWKPGNETTGMALNNTSRNNVSVLGKRAKWRSR